MKLAVVGDEAILDVRSMYRDGYNPSDGRIGGFMICMDCGCRMYESLDAIVEEYRGEKFSVSGTKHYVCPECGGYSVGAKEAKILAKGLVERYTQVHDLSLGGERACACRVETQGERPIEGACGPGGQHHPQSFSP